MTSMPHWVREHDASLCTHSTEINAYRKAHWDAFLQRGFPQRREEQFKYTDLMLFDDLRFTTHQNISETAVKEAMDARIPMTEPILLVFVNGCYEPNYSALGNLPKEVIACTLGDALKLHPELIKRHWPAQIDAVRFPFASLNAAFFADGLFIYVPDDIVLKNPLHLLFIADGETNFRSEPHHVIVLGERSELTLVEEYNAHQQAAYLLNSVVHVNVGRAAYYHYYKVQQESSQAKHLAHQFVVQQQDSIFESYHFSFGGAFARNDVIVDLKEAGAHCSTTGFYQLYQANQYVDYHIDITHRAPHTQSDMLYKGIIDAKARAVFNGRLHVVQGAEKMRGLQANHNLLLSPKAEVYSKPELEIYAEDVQCKHGATMGQLDEGAIFYLCSRGIDRAQAINLLLNGFANDIIQRISHPDVKQWIEKKVITA